ncbi:hypothetical protein VTH06DRAFT_3177 [Thermothelomyces fergusii]
MYYLLRQPRTVQLLVREAQNQPDPGSPLMYLTSSHLDTSAKKGNGSDQRKQKPGAGTVGLGGLHSRIN